MKLLIYTAFHPGKWLKQQPEDTKRTSKGQHEVLAGLQLLALGPAFSGDALERFNRATKEKDNSVHSKAFACMALVLLTCRARWVPTKRLTATSSSRTKQTSNLAMP